MLTYLKIGVIVGLIHLILILIGDILLRLKGEDDFVKPKYIVTTCVFGIFVWPASIPLNIWVVYKMLKK